jgi:hypothetical protein
MSSFNAAKSIGVRSGNSAAMGWETRPPFEAARFSSTDRPIDIAERIFKHTFQGLPIPNFSDRRPNIFDAILTPGVIHTQLSHMLNGQILFWRGAIWRQPGTRVINAFTAS